MSQNCEKKSWKYIFSLSKEIQKKVRDANYQPDVIVGIARGGWVPARNLCDLLDVTDLLSVKVEHWGKTATPSGNAEIKYGLSDDLRGKKVLLVDDLTDTGESMSKAYQHVKQYSPQMIKTASLIHMENSEFKPDFHGTALDEWKWIIFPWNVTEDIERLTKKILEKEKSLKLDEIKVRLKEENGLKTEDIDFEQIMNELVYRGTIVHKNNKYHIKN